MDGRLCYEAALLQRSTDADDVEAVLVYLEAGITSYFKSGEVSLSFERRECFCALVLGFLSLLPWKILRKHHKTLYLHTVTVTLYSCSITCAYHVLL